MPPRAQTTSLKLPPRLRTRLGALAKAASQSPHALMLAVLERYVDAEEGRRAFVNEAVEADAELAATAKIHRHVDVENWFVARMSGQRVKAPKASTW